MTLAERAFRSGMVVTASSLAMRLANLGALVVLARVLVPQDFGAVSLALVVVTTSTLFSSSGMDGAIIASRYPTHRAAHHAGVLNLGLAVILFSLAFFGAEALAGLLGASDLGPVFRLMSLIILFETLTVVPNALLSKELQFGRQSAAQLGAIIVQFGLAIVLALAGMGVWSLAIGHVVGAALRCLSISVLAPRVGWVRPQPWDGALARELLRFGATTMTTGFIRHLYTNADKVIIGRLFGTSGVGFYSQSYNITNIPVQSVSQVTNGVLLPVYTRVRDDPERLANGYSSAFRLVAFLTLPMSVGLFLLAPQVVITLLGDQWRPSVVILQILAGTALFRPLSGTTFPLFLAIRRPGLNLATAIVQAVSMAPLLFLLHPLGVEGIAAAVSATFGIGFIFNMWQVVQRTSVPISLRRLGRQLLPILAATGVMAGCVAGAKAGVTALGADLESPLALLFLVTTGVVAFLAAAQLFDRSLIADVLRLARSKGRTQEVQES